MLTEQRRQQLDAIVQHMVANKEKDSTIQLVVNDFKQKYSNETVNERTTGTEQSLYDQNRGIAQKTAGFLGMEPLGQGIATAGRVMTGGVAQDNQSMIDTAQSVNPLLDRMYKLPVGSPERQQLAEQLRKLTGNNATQGLTPQQIDPGTALSNGQVIGSAINTGVNVLSGGSLSDAGALGSYASKINAITQPFEATSKAGRIGNATLSNIAPGAIAGFGQALSNKETVGQALTSGAISGSVTGLLAGALQAAGELAKYLTSRNVTAPLYDSALGVDRKTIQAGRSPSGQMMDEGMIGTKRNLMQKSEQIIQNSNNQINTILKDSGSFHNTQPILDEIKMRMRDQLGLNLSDQELNKVIEGLPLNRLQEYPQIDTETLNKLRMQLNKNYLSNSSWLTAQLGEKQPEKVLAMQAAYRAMSDTIKATDSRLPGLFAREADAITARNALDKNLSSHHILLNTLEGLGGLLAGVGHSGISPKAIMEGLLSYGAIKGATSAPIKTGLAVGLDRLGNSIAQPGNVAKGIKVVARLTGRQAIAKASR